MHTVNTGTATQSQPHALRCTPLHKSGLVASVAFGKAVGPWIMASEQEK